MCDILREVYREIYHESFNFSVLDDRIKLQKAVYILENLGINIGDYSFSWNKYGPYSLALDFDAKKCESYDMEENIRFSSVAEEGFYKIREYIGIQNVYSCVQWMECITSLHYLSYVLGIDQEKIYEELKVRKPYLSDMRSNHIAMKIAKEIKVG